MRFLTPKLQLTLGLIGILSMVLQAAFLAGLLPSSENSERAKRAELAESIAISTSLMIQNQQHSALQSLIRQSTERNNSIIPSKAPTRKSRTELCNS